MARMAQRLIPLLAMLALVLGIFAYKAVYQLPVSPVDEPSLSAYMDPTSQWKDELLSVSANQSTEIPRGPVSLENKSLAPSPEEETGK